MLLLADQMPLHEQLNLLCLVEDIRQAAVKDSSSSRSSQSHFHLLRLIDQLRLAVETPTDTVLRLIYQVRLIPLSCIETQI